MTTCQSCGAEVVFVPSAKTGKPMILDAKPEKRVLLVDGTLSLHGLVGPIDKPADASDPMARVLSVYIDHHATCPEAAAWKGKHR